MIKLTKFKSSDHEFVLNADLIETIEETPDTVVTLTNGKKIIVTESMDEVVRKVMEFRRALARNLR
jgi:flagellar protein FlbD